MQPRGGWHLLGGKEAGPATPDVLFSVPVSHGLDAVPCGDCAGRGESTWVGDPEGSDVAKLARLLPPVVLLVD